MKTETLQRALVAVRELLVVADRNLSNWREVRDRRRRQEAAFLRGIVRIEGSQRKAASVIGISQSVISRTIDRDGHKKVSAAIARKRSDATNLNVASPERETTNVVPLREQRRRRPDWERREPRRPEMHKWYEQYLGWTLTAQATARMVLFNLSKGALPDDAYYPIDSKPSESDSTVGQKKGPRRERATH